MKRTLVLSVTVAMVALLPFASAYAFNSAAQSAIIVDYNTGAVLYEDNADEPLPPASLSKLMTLNMVFEALHDGRLTLQDKLPVSKHAMSYAGGSSMFLDTSDRVTVEDLIRGVVVLSGNDACVVLAEALSPDGTEAGFARQMTEHAKDIGMAQSTFANSNGWPAPNNLMTARDLALLIRRLITEFPEHYHYFSEREFAFDNRTPANRFNRNPLLKNDVPGADGLKTGYTSKAGYGLAGSAERAGMRVIFVLLGLPSIETRAREGEGVVGWYRRNFIGKQIFKAGEEVLRAPVWLGAQSTVPVVLERNLAVPIPISTKEGVGVVAIFDTMVEAPVSEGQRVGRLEVTIPGIEESASLDLFAAEAVEVGGLATKVLATTRKLFRQFVIEPILQISS